MMPMDPNQMPPVPESGPVGPPTVPPMGLTGAPTAPGATSGYTPEPPSTLLPEEMPMPTVPPDRFAPRERTYRSEAHHEKHEKKSKHHHPQRGKKKGKK